MFAPSFPGTKPYPVCCRALCPWRVPWAAAVRREGARRGRGLGGAGTLLKMTAWCKAPKVSASFWYKHLLMSCSFEQRGDVSAAGRLQRGRGGETAGTSNCWFSQSCLGMHLEPFSASLRLMALVASSRLPWQGRRRQWGRKKAKLI